MQIKVITNLKALEGWTKSSNKAIQEAATKALNDTAFKVQKDWKAEMRQVFDRPTAYITSSVRVQQATETNMVAIIEPTYMGGKGVEPSKILRAEVFGGPRRMKRYEVALQRAGILPNGYFTVPGMGAAPLLDQYGNLKGSFIVQLLSYLKTFSEQGYRSNMTAKRKAKLADKGKTASGYAVINGVEYFVSQGQLPGGKGVHDKANPTWHLPPGIFARSGIHGSNLTSILMFVRQPHYRKRLNLESIGDPAKVQAQYERNLRYRISKL